MSAVLGFFDVIRGLGATIMMPIIICILGIILRAGIGKSIRAGLTVGIGFVGLNLVIGLIGTYLGPAVEAMVKIYGFHLDVVDVGWPSAAAIAFASNVGMIIIPVGIIVNVVMLVTNTTQTIDIDIWDYWHFAFTGALVAVLTGNQLYGVIAAVINMIIIMVIGDWTAKGVEETLDLPGVSLPHGFTAAYAPIAIVLNKLIDMIPGVNKIDFNLEKMQKKFGVFGEPILVGTVLGAVIGIVAHYGYKDVMTLAIEMGAVLVLIPKMASLLMEGLLPISDAASAFIKTRFKNKGKIYIGLDSAVGVGHPVTLSVALILVPIAVFLAVILPGNHVLPFADLAVIPWMFVLITPVVKGNGFRALLIGTVCLIGGLYIATDLSPLITTAAINAQYIKAGSGSISSICDGANPLTWILARLNSLGAAVGLGVPAVAAVVMAWINRKKILKEASELHAAEKAD